MTKVESWRVSFAFLPKKNLHGMDAIGWNSTYQKKNRTIFFLIKISYTLI